MALRAMLILVVAAFLPAGVGQRDARHLGTAAEAVVGVEVATTSRDDVARSVRRGTGLLLRCDGWVLAPAALFSRNVSVGGRQETAGRQAITIVLNPGTPREERHEAGRPAFTSRTVGFATVRADGLHAPAARPAIPEGLPDGAPLEALWVPTGPGERFGPVTRAPARLRALSLPVERGQAPLVEVDGAPAELPAGAVLVGPGGFPVAQAVGGRTGVEFQSFSALHRATNCTTAVAAYLRPEGPEASPMVAVPGGRVLLNGAILAEQPDAGGDPVACVPPFEIDEFEVTNNEYWQFWLTLPKVDRRRLGFRSNYRPWTWAPNDPPYPPTLGRLPVLGVPLPGAMAYARWRGKRLPTPYEWLLAGFGTRGEAEMPEWARQYIAERQAVWRRVRDLHIEYARRNPELQQQGVFLPSIFHLPWIARQPLFLEASRFSKEVVDRYVQPLWEMWHSPLYVLPVGSRPFDRSPCGAMDMALNAMELVQPFPGPPALGAARYMEVAWTVQPPSRVDRWEPRKVDVIMDGKPIQPLSRLYRRSAQGPSAEDLMLWSNLNETVQMLAPLQGWEVRMTGANQTTGITWPTGRSPYERVGRPAGLQLWAGMPPRFRQEMGWPVPLNNPDVHAPPGVHLYYRLPVGFRCAR